MPKCGRSMMLCGMIWPYPTTTIRSALNDCSCSKLSGRRIRSGWNTGRPRSSAALFTGDSATCCPRLFGRSGWVNTAKTECPEETSASSEGTANSGVPRKTTRIKYSRLVPLAVFLELLDLAFDNVPLQRAEVVQEQDAVQMVDFVEQSTRKQFFASNLDRLP